MGKYIFTINLRMEVESPEITDGESGSMIKVNPETLYQTVANLRSDTLSEMDELTASEFSEATAKANEINAVLSQMEELEILSVDDDDDEDDDED